MRACVMEFTDNWDNHLPMIEFAYNNSYHSSIDMAPYEALYGRRCRTPVCWDEVGEARLLGPEIVQHMVEQVKIIKAKLKAAQDRQKSYADEKHRDVHFDVGDRVFIKVSPWKGVMRFGKKEKLSPSTLAPLRFLRGSGSWRTD